MSDFVDFKSTISRSNRNKLPHWHQAGKIQFVTFRLADSMPEQVANALDSDHDKWLDDCHGQCILRHPDVRKIVTDAIMYYDTHLYDVIAFVIMPNHVHLLLRPLVDERITKIVGQIKKYSGRLINSLYYKEGKIWQREVFDRLVRNNGELRDFIEYIKHNPVNLSKNQFTLYVSNNIAIN